MFKIMTTENIKQFINVLIHIRKSSWMLRAGYAELPAVPAKFACRESGITFTGSARFTAKLRHNEI